MAIAFDATTTNGNAGTGTSQTLAHTCTGSNLILFVGVSLYDPTGGDTLTGITYNGVAMTQVTKLANSANEEIYLYYLVNPASGTHNIVASASVDVDEFYVRASSFTGAKQSSVPDASTATAPSTTTSVTTTVTTSADNCWLVGMYMSSGSNLSAGVNTTARAGTTSRQFCDSNGAQTPAGSKSMNVTGASSMMSGIMASFAPNLNNGNMLLVF